MHWKTYPDASAFRAATGDFLRKDPLSNQMPLGIASIVLSEPTRYGTGCYFHAVTDDNDDAILGALVQTAAFVPLLSMMPAEVAAFAGIQFATDHPEVSGVNGEDYAALAFASAAFATRAAKEGVENLELHLEDSMGLFSLESVASDLPRTSGSGRFAQSDDADLLDRWISDFRREAVPNDPPAPPGAGAAAVARGMTHFWTESNGTPVSFANYGRDLGDYISIGPVYTPPELRGHGYATALVAEMSSLALSQGRKGLTLFTDLSNPTSNKIYERIGFKRIGTFKKFKIVSKKADYNGE